MWGKVQEQPCNYAVWPFLAADLSYLGQIHGERQLANGLPQGHSFRSWAMAMPAISAFVMAAATMGDVLTGFSSKKVGGTPDEHEAARQQLITHAATILAAQPKETQEMLAQNAAQYLSTQQGLRMVDLDAEKLTAQILDKVKEHAQAIPTSGISR